MKDSEVEDDEYSVPGDDNVNSGDDDYSVPVDDHADSGRADDEDDDYKEDGFEEV